MHYRPGRARQRRPTPVNGQPEGTAAWRPRSIFKSSQMSHLPDIHTQRTCSHQVKGVHLAEAVEIARIAEGEREVVGGGRRGDSGWERLEIRLWHDLEYAAVVRDSERILADALTPAAWVLLTRIAGCTLDPGLPARPIMLPRYTYRVSVMRPRATQRSPPQD